MSFWTCECGAVPGVTYDCVCPVVTRVKPYRMAAKRCKSPAVSRERLSAMRSCSEFEEREKAVAELKAKFAEAEKKVREANRARTEQRKAALAKIPKPPEPDHTWAIALATLVIMGTIMWFTT